MSNNKYRNYLILLYPDDLSHQNAINILKSKFECAYILHDKDCDDNTGEIKKPHYHFVIKLANARSINGLAKELNIASNYIEPSHCLQSSLLYLIHYNNNDKYQYSIDEVYGNLKKDLFKLINTNNKSYDDIVGEIFNFIYTYNGFITSSIIVRWVIDNGYYGQFRQSYNVFKDLIYEHNNYYASCSNNKGGVN